MTTAIDGRSAAPLLTTREVVDVDPATQLVDVNVRRDPRPGDDFCTSVSDHGVLVLVPVVAVRTADGGCVSATATAAPWPP